MSDPNDNKIGRAGLYCWLKSGFLPVVTLALGAGLSGCGNSETVGEALGYQQKGPDEMSVIKRPPLTVPPDFNLRPPRPGEPRSEADAASKAARDTLIGPSSELEPDTSADSETEPSPGITPVNVTAPSDTTSAGDRAKATLTGKEKDWQRYHKSPPVVPKEEETAELSEVEDAESAGQNTLLSRTNRVERDLDALNETRAENRIDGALLRRLLAWQPTPSDAGEASLANEDAQEPESIVRIVRREQTPVPSEKNLE